MAAAADGACGGPTGPEAACPTRSRPRRVAVAAHRAGDEVRSPRTRTGAARDRPVECGVLHAAGLAAPEGRPSRPLGRPAACLGRA